MRVVGVAGAVVVSACHDVPTAQWLAGICLFCIVQIGKAKDMAEFMYDRPDSFYGRGGTVFLVCQAAYFVSAGISVHIKVVC